MELEIDSELERKEVAEKRKASSTLSKPRAKKTKTNENVEPIVIPDTITVIPDTQNEIPSWQATNTINPMICECGNNYQADHFKNQWISCEGRCGKWFCSTCAIFQSRYDFNLNVNV